MFLLCLAIFFSDTAPTEIYTLSLHDALPIYERLRIPRLAGAAEDSQARQVVSLGHLVAMGHQATHEGGGDPQHGCLVVFDHPPEAIRGWMIGRSLVQHHRRAEDEGSEDEPRAHHPADVRVPEHGVVG